MTTPPKSPEELLKYTPDLGGILDFWCDLYATEWSYIVADEIWLYLDEEDGITWRQDNLLLIKRQIQDLMKWMNALAREGLAETGSEVYEELIKATSRTASKVNNIEQMAKARCAAER